MKKKKDNRLKPPSLIKRTWKTLLYYLVPFVIVSVIFAKLFTIDGVALALDEITMGIITIKAIITVIWTSFLIRFFFKMVNFIIYSVYTVKYDKEQITYGYTQTDEGVQGVGKTLTLGNKLVFTAAEKDRQQRIKYYTALPFAEEYTGSQLRDYNVLKSAYSFYENNPDKTFRYSPLLV